MTNVLEDLQTLVLSGSEEEVRAFIKERWNELPEQAQTQISAALFIDGLRQNRRENEEFADYQKELLVVLEGLARDIDNHKKMT